MSPLFGDVESLVHTQGSQLTLTLGTAWTSSAHALWTRASDICLRLLVPGAPVREMEGQLGSRLWHRLGPSVLVGGVGTLRPRQATTHRVGGPLGAFL